MVGVEPVPRRVVAAGHEWINVVGKRIDLRGHVAIDARLDRRLAVAKHVVRHAQPWADVFPVRNIGQRSERARADPHRRRRGLSWNPHIEVVEADPCRHRDTVQRPLVLGINAEVGVYVGQRRVWSSG